MIGYEMSSVAFKRAGADMMQGQSQVTWW